MYNECECVGGVRISVGDLNMRIPANFLCVQKLLKPGGEMYFSDVYSTRRVPKSLREDKVLLLHHAPSAHPHSAPPPLQVLWGECISGALYWNVSSCVANALTNVCIPS